jgi:hypothetical protein
LSRHAEVGGQAEALWAIAEHQETDRQHRCGDHHPKRQVCPSPTTASDQRVNDLREDDATEGDPNARRGGGHTATGDEPEVDDVLTDKGQPADGCSAKGGEADRQRERGPRQRHDHAGKAHRDRDRRCGQTRAPPVDPAANERCRQGSRESSDRVGEGDLAARQGKVTCNRIKEQRDTIRLAGSVMNEPIAPPARINQP